MESLEVNLDKAPCLCKFIGRNKILKSVSPKPNVIIRYFSGEFHGYQTYLESLFCTLEQNGVTYPAGKIHDLLNTDTGNDILSEFEVAARLSQDFNIKPDYPLNQSEPKKSKKLDLQVEDKLTNEKSLIEVATVYCDYFNGDEDAGKAHIDIPGRVRCLHKIERQLKDIYDKKNDLKMPLILLFNFAGIYYPDGTMRDMEVLGGLYGALQVSFWKDGSGSVVKEGLTRASGDDPYYGVYGIKISISSRK